MTGVPGTGPPKPTGLQDPTDPFNFWYECEIPPSVLKKYCTRPGLYYYAMSMLDVDDIAVGVGLGMVRIDSPEEETWICGIVHCWKTPRLADYYGVILNWIQFYIEGAKQGPGNYVPEPGHDLAREMGGLVRLGERTP